MKEVIPDMLQLYFDKLSMILKNEIEEFKKLLEEDIIGELHHTLGRYLRNSWCLWEPKSQLSSWFKLEFGIWHADDMSGIILISFHRFLNNKPINLQKQVQHYLNYWKKQENN